jgi:glutamate-1-semialdehyde 2,1-aminomutase
VAAVVTASDQLFARARELMPGGVNSPVRAFGAVSGTPRVIRRGRGCRLEDVDGRSYLDYVGSWGAMILGHGDPAVKEAVARALEDGTSFGTASERELELAEEIVARVPSIKKLRMVSTGTEAVMSAVRLARAATGRRLIVKFDGGYHGHSDGLLAKAGSGLATAGLPASPGVTEGAARDTLSLPYNDVASVEHAFAEAGREIAAVLVEPVAGNMGVVPPQDGFLAALRRVSQGHGALLIFDEVITGFRVARGGAQELYGVTPDLTTLGKIVGGGLPAAAYGGRAELMAMVAPEGPVYQAGTLSGNPLAMAAGVATLRRLDAAAYARLEAAASRLAEGLQTLANEAGLPAVIQRVGSMLTLFFRAEPVRDFEEARGADHARFAAFFHEMLARGVHLPPSGYEAWFLSLAHDDAALEATLLAARAAFLGVAATRRR